MSRKDKPQNPPPPQPKRPQPIANPQPRTAPVCHRCHRSPCICR